MARISTDSFLRFCESLDGQELSTLARHRKFKVRVVDDGLEFTPHISKKPRHHSRQYVDGVLDHFEQSGSFMVTQYSGYTANASYMLALIDRYVKRAG